MKTTATSHPDSFRAWASSIEASQFPSREEARRLLWALGPAVLLLAVCLLATGPLPQPESYHHFPAGRTLLGLPNALTVLSNLPFAIVGMHGLRWLCVSGDVMPAHLKRCYGVLLAGIALTGAGSAFYHWSPASESLVWDRLPMAVAFMGLLAGFLTERLRLQPATSGWLLGTLVAYGLASVVYWSAFDDLRLYAVAQFYPIGLIPIVLWLTPARFTRDCDWLAAIGIYVVAKLLEELDGSIFAAAGLVSGHTLKHLAAAAGAWWLYRMLLRRQPHEAECGVTVHPAPGS
ncbi:MAG: hypothetical protein AB7F78_14600 [Hyphomicrobiaceae bacterium]